MTILYLSDMDLGGSGYFNIAANLCTHLAVRGYDVQAIGFGYQGQEHNYPFRIVALPGVEYTRTIVQNLINQGVEIEAVIVALDIPLQENILQQLNGKLPYIGLFPLEAPPLCQSWAMALLRMDACLIMSQFGVAEAHKAGIPAEFIPIGVDCETWRTPTQEERATLRQGLGIGEDTFVVLTVAANQERKNLSRSMEIFADAFGPKAATASRGKDAQYLLVTQPNSAVGWKLVDYAMDLGIYGQMSIYERGMPVKNLWALFAAADCFLLTSKAEGLAMPVLEAMSMRLPVVGTGCTAIEEHLQDGRGWLIEPDYVHVDPFGNGNRYMASRTHGASVLGALHPDRYYEGFIPEVLSRAQAYAHARTWDKAADVVEQAVVRVTSGKA